MLTNLSGFAANYPPQYQVPNGTLPQAWVDKYNKVKAEGKIPTLEVNPVAVKEKGNPVYKGRDGNEPGICSFTAGCHTDDDFFLAPDGTFVVSLTPETKANAFGCVSVTLT